MKFPLNLASYKKLVHFSKKNEHLNPARDWYVIVLCGAFVLVASVAWNVWFFLDTVSDKETTTFVSEERAPDTTALTQVKDLFNKRLEERNRYRGEYTFVDPSR